MLSATNRKTGEILDISEYDLDFTDFGTKESSCILFSNNRIFPVSSIVVRDKVTEEDGDGVFGKTVGRLNPKWRFSKAYHKSDPNFNVTSYYKYWYRVVLNLDQDTNVVLVKTGRKVMPVKNISELAKVCGATIPVTYKFMSCCKSKNLIEKIRYGDDYYYVANPYMVLNGVTMPSFFMKVFDLECVNG